MKILCIVSMMIVTATQMANGQNRSTPGQPLPSKGTLHVFQEHIEVPPTTLDGLVKGSATVVDGVIQSITPRVRVDTPETGEWKIISDFIVKVDRVVRGKAIGGRIMFHRLGGSVGDRKMLGMEDDAELKVGDRVILFLAPLESPSPDPTVSHFRVIGRWAGRFLVGTNNTVTVHRRASTELSDFNGMQVERVLERIKSVRAE
jgi:hypothetical protein